jgi:molybdate transport system substrate-binding protein
MLIAARRMCLPAACTGSFKCAMISCLPAAVFPGYKNMLKRVMAVLAVNLAMSLSASPGHAMEKLNVMISGGFSLAYHQLLPEFERSSGAAVSTLSGASQGTGPKTIKSQLEHGTEVDVVILSKEGLEELMTAGLIAKGSEAELATVPLGAAVR